MELSLRANSRYHFVLTPRKCFAFTSGLKWALPPERKVSLFYPMGLSGLEPPTSRLSGVRSNRLSYKPIFVILADTQT